MLDHREPPLDLRPLERGRLTDGDDAEDRVEDCESRTYAASMSRTTSDSVSPRSRAAACAACHSSSGMRKPRTGVLG